MGFFDVAGFYTQYTDMIEFRFGFFDPNSYAYANSTQEILSIIAKGQMPVPVRHGAVHIQHQRRVRQIPQQAGIIRMIIGEYLPALLLAGGKHFVRSGQRRALQVLHLIFCQRRGHAPLHNVGVVHRLGAAEFF